MNGSLLALVHQATRVVLVQKKLCIDRRVTMIVIVASGPAQALASAHAVSTFAGALSNLRAVITYSALSRGSFDCRPRRLWRGCARIALRRREQAPRCSSTAAIRA